jgi:uncharacterized protein YdeI (YjbR/CyaY-like superfamily)
VDTVRPSDGARAPGAEVTATVGKVAYFESPADFRRWLAAHHATAKELRVGFHKKGSGTPTITWPESVDQALCFGWIDGVRKRVDDTRYTIRFTPRRATSNWSTINIARVGVLRAQGLMMPPGLKAFEAREEKRSGVYAYENRPKALDTPYEKLFRRDKAAWDFFQAQPPGYRKLAAYWVMSAKKEETAQKRLARLIADSAAGKRI